ncbi:MAG: hypothetical protein NC313_14890, partial [Butyrivibrio sp.]|nr:hypothetical protein [Butyrivibrio sp.]
GCGGKVKQKTILKRIIDAVMLLLFWEYIVIIWLRMRKWARLYLYIIPAAAAYPMTWRRGLRQMELSNSKGCPVYWERKKRKAENFLGN